MIIGVFLFKYFNNQNITYIIYAEKIDDLSPDRHLVVRKNGKETKKYKHIIYDNGTKRAILCYKSNPTANIFSLDIDELIIVLQNDKEVVAKLVKEEK